MVALSASHSIHGHKISHLVLLYLLPLLSVHLWLCVAHGEKNKLSGKKLAGGKENELALSYSQRQPSSGQLSSFPLRCGSEKLWQRLVSVLKWV